MSSTALKSRIKFLSKTVFLLKRQFLFILVKYCDPVKNCFFKIFVLWGTLKP